MRPSLALHTKGVALADVVAADLVPARDVVDAPPPALLLILVALILLVGAFALAAVGLGSPPASSGTLAAAQVQVTSADVTEGSLVPIDLSKPVVVGLSSTAPAADHVRLTLCLLGLCKVEATAPVTGPTGQPRVGLVDVGSKRYLVAGRLTARVDLLRGGQIVGHEQFAARSTQSRLLTAPAIVTIALLLFLLAYAESSLRLLWRGRRIPSASVSLLIVSAAIGAVAPALLWVLGTDPPVVVTIAACAGLGAAAGLLGGFAARRAGRRRRYRRLVAGEGPAGARAS